jgi:uncharacterized membrane protein YeaQ/YmgE (transglycosylase-associated protein family)
MTILEFLLLLVIAGVCGALGQAIAGYSLGGILVSVVVGFIGALLGSWISVKLGLPEILSVQIGGESFPIIWSIIGSVAFVIVIGLVTRKR